MIDFITLHGPLQRNAQIESKLSRPILSLDGNLTHTRQGQDSLYGRELAPTGSDSD